MYSYVDANLKVVQIYKGWSATIGSTSAIMHTSDADGVPRALVLRRSGRRKIWTDDPRTDGVRMVDISNLLCTFQYFRTTLKGDGEKSKKPRG
jgi:hypothetical protein